MLFVSKSSERQQISVSISNFRATFSGHSKHPSPLIITVRRRKCLESCECCPLVPLVTPQQAVRMNKSRERYHIRRVSRWGQTRWADHHQGTKKYLDLFRFARKKKPNEEAVKGKKKYVWLSRRGESVNKKIIISWNKFCL